MTEGQHKTVIIKHIWVLCAAVAVQGIAVQPWRLSRHWQPGQTGPNPQSIVTHCLSYNRLTHKYILSAAIKGKNRYKIQ